MMVFLSRVYLNNGGYDNRGQYWGLGAPLYEYEADTDFKSTSYFSGHLRAGSRAEARDKIRAEWPNRVLRFYG